MNMLLIDVLYSVSCVGCFILSGVLCLESWLICVGVVFIMWVMLDYLSRLVCIIDWCMMCSVFLRFIMLLVVVCYLYVLCLLGCGVWLVVMMLIVLLVRFLCMVRMFFF